MPTGFEDSTRSTILTTNFLNNTCDDCGHITVCKFKESVLKKIDEIKGIDDDTNLIEVSIKCKSWIKNSNYR